MLENQVALVTGASRGIGHAIALALGGGGCARHRHGDHAGGRRALTASCSRRTDTTAAGRSWMARDAASIEALMARARRRRTSSPPSSSTTPRITRDTLLLRMKPEDWDAVIATNLTVGVPPLSKACLRHMMKERHGRIVNLTSIVGLTGNPGQANYAAAKAGDSGFHQVARARGRLTRHHRQRGGARLHRHRHDARAQRRAARGAAGARYRWDGSARRPMSPPRCCFWSRRRRPTSPARRCT